MNSVRSDLSITEVRSLQLVAARDKRTKPRGIQRSDRLIGFRDSTLMQFNASLFIFVHILVFIGEGDDTTIVSRTGVIKDDNIYEMSVHFFDTLCYIPGRTRSRCVCIYIPACDISNSRTESLKPLQESCKTPFRLTLIGDCFHPVRHCSKQT